MLDTIICRQLSTGVSYFVEVAIAIYYRDENQMTSWWIIHINEK